MKAFRTLLAWIRGGCIYFTVISLFMILLNLALGGSDAAMRGISPTAFLLFFPCGLGISAGGLFLKMKRIPAPARGLLHFFCTLLSILLFVWLPANPTARPSTVLIMLVAFSILYWLLFLLVHVTKKRIRSLLEED